MDSVIQQLPPSEFPSLLREIPDPPKKLYVRGVLPPRENTVVCVVGSRKYTQYGKRATETLIKALAGQPVTVVSGLALGIDALAHKTALDAGINTVAVPGSGLSPDVIAPRTNAQLAEQIISSDGALLSEFEPDFQATPWSFPQRNRIMAGLAHAVLVIEASEQSGTLITARLAGEYGRDVLAVPGSIFSANSHGANRLITDGATPITSSDDLCEALNLSTKETSQKQLDLSQLTESEQAVVAVLAEPTERDEIIRQSGLDVSKANMIITALEMKGVVKEELGKIYLCSST